MMSCAPPISTSARPRLNLRGRCRGRAAPESLTVLNVRRRTLLAALGLAAVMAPSLAPSVSQAQAAPPLPPKPVGAKRYFHADISWANNTYYTPSQATGAADFMLDLDTLTLHWVLQYKDLSSPPTAITLNAPAQPGATGAAIVNLAVPSLVSPTRGSAKLSDAQAEYLLTGWSYALITTRKYTKGEARGQLDRLRQPPAAFQ
jgi:hypothetical protein